MPSAIYEGLWHLPQQTVRACAAHVIQTDDALAFSAIFASQFSCLQVVSLELVPCSLSTPWTLQGPDWQLMSAQGEHASSLVSSTASRRLPAGEGPSHFTRASVSRFRSVPSVLNDARLWMCSWSRLEAPGSSSAKLCMHPSRLSWARPMPSDSQVTGRIWCG